MDFRRKPGRSRTTATWICHIPLPSHDVPVLCSASRDHEVTLEHWSQWDSWHETLRRTRARDVDQESRAGHAVRRMHRATNSRTAESQSSCLLAEVQLGRYVAANGDDDAAENPASISRADVEPFQAWMIETRSAATALNKRKCLQQFVHWLAEDEQAVERSPVDGVRPPQPPTKLAPAISTDDTTRLLDSCKGTGFMTLRDQAMIRLYCNTGATTVRSGQSARGRHRLEHGFTGLPRQGR